MTTRAGGRKFKKTTAGGASARRGKRVAAISEAKKDLFFETVAESCNVTRSAKIAGMSTTTAYRHRKNDAAFRQRWREAVAIGYAQLEMAMLERALVGRSKEICVAGENKTIQEYDDRMGLALLKLHRETVREVEGIVDTGQVDEAAERILMRLRRMRAAATGETIEIKQAIDRVALIAEALRANRR